MALFNKLSGKITTNNIKESIEFSPEIEKELVFGDLLSSCNDILSISEAEAGKVDSPAENAAKLLVSKEVDKTKRLKEKQEEEMRKRTEAEERAKQRLETIQNMQA